MAEFLLELFSEEIPARMQARAAEDLKRLVLAGLDAARLGYDRAEAYVTPRRLALVVEGLPTRQPDLTEERKGPRVGSPEKAIQGFLKAAGLASVDQAEVRETDKGSFYVATRTQAGRSAAEVLADVVGSTLAQLPWPKSMRWGSGRFRWVRPLHHILAIFEGHPIAFSLALEDGGAVLTAGAKTCGHRFLAPEPFPVTGFDDYRTRLLAARVVLDRDERKRLILESAERLADGEDLELRDDPGLLEEVAGLVEWPVVMMGRIDQAYMDVPPEVLTTAMRAHQKYFSLLEAGGRLAPRFIVVANKDAPDGGAAIIAGNERVLRARLSDAKFFWDQDRKQALAGRVAALAARVFHARLGSDLDRTGRLTELARLLAPACRAEGEQAARAAHLAKADLVTGMVGEFPELQGVMGRYYALHDGEAASVADAIAEHYAPQGPADRCPTAPVSTAVALADKIDTLTGFFAIDEKPTGSRDPYALRRAALGVIRLILDNGLRLHLRQAFHQAHGLYGPTVTLERDAETVAQDLLAFFADRLKVHLKDQGVRHDLISAVFSGGGEDDLVRLLARVDALKRFLDTDDGANLLTAYRRASNIVRIEENKDGTSYSGEADQTLLSQQEESALHEALSVARQRIATAVAEERFENAMTTLAALRTPVDAFFDHVTVNCADAKLRANRLRLLSHIRTAVGGVADFSQIEG